MIRVVINSISQATKLRDPERNQSSELKGAGKLGELMNQCTKKKGGQSGRISDMACRHHSFFFFF